MEKFFKHFMNIIINIYKYINNNYYLFNIK